MKHLFFIITLLLVLTSCGPVENNHTALKETIVNEITKKMPLIKQTYFNNEYDIKIDSLVITTNGFPYDGYLVTTFTKGFQTRNVYVEINNCGLKLGGGAYYDINWDFDRNILENSSTVPTQSLDKLPWD